MYHFSGKKPEIMTISLQEMLKDKLLSHSSLIFKIFVVFLLDFWEIKEFFE